MNKVIIAEAQPLARHGLAAVLAEQGGFEIAGVAQNRDSLLQLLNDMDEAIIMFGDHPDNAFGHETMQHILKHHPKMRVLAISGIISPENVLPAVSAGVDGFLTKDCSIEEIVQATQSVARGDRFFCNTVLQVIINGKPEEADCDSTKLSEREQEIARMVALGNTNKQIAEQLFISVHTVHTHRKNIMKKLGCHSSAELTMFCMRTGLVSIEE